jgi:hypothetical protein
VRKDLHFGLIRALTIRGLAVTSYEEMRLKNPNDAMWSGPQPQEVSR